MPTKMSKCAGGHLLVYFFILIILIIEYLQLMNTHY